MMFSEITSSIQPEVVHYIVMFAVGFGAMKVALAGIARDIKDLRIGDTGFLGTLRADVDHNVKDAREKWDSNKKGIARARGEIKEVTERIEVIEKHCLSNHPHAERSEGQ